MRELFACGKARKRATARGHNIALDCSLTARFLHRDWEEKLFI